MNQRVILAAGLGVMASATAIAWIYNRMTLVEELKQGQEKAQADILRSRAAAAQQSQQAEQQVHLQQIGVEQSQLLLQAIQARRDMVADLPNELNMLQKTIDAEVANTSSSPYRKSVLRREYARIEDARIRVQEYAHYLDYEQAHIQALLADQAYQELLTLNTADALLPAQWLYAGKLVVVSLKELGLPLPRFKHRISFARDNIVQRAQALRYGDEIPVLIRSAHKKHRGLFYGCVARGATYYHHIMTGTALEFSVKHVVRGKHAIGTLHDGLLQAYLPIAQLKHPGLHLISGQVLHVHPSSYDLCLNKNPFDTQSRSIEVSEFNYQARTQSNYQQVYLETDEALLDTISDARFYDLDEPWTLLGYCLESHIVTLAKATVRLTCQVREDGAMLAVQTITQTPMLQLGLDTPFRFTMIARELAKSERVGWAYGIDAFLHFCAQTALDTQDAPERVAQGRFYQQWERVIAYQRDCEENAALDFSLEATEHSEEMLSLHRDRLPPKDRAQFDIVVAWLKDILSDTTTLNPSQYIDLQHWDAERCDYISSVRHPRRIRPLYTVTPDCITVEANLSLLSEPTIRMLRLHINIPNIPLQRQSQALDDFFQDRLVNPALKNILLAPEHYLPKHLEPSEPLIWSSELDNSQKAVVELALKERHIALIQGPPGAGKTTAIVELLYQLFTQQPSMRVLLVSQQNTAVDNALSKFIQEHGSQFAHAVKAIRIGNTDKMSDDIQPISFDQQYADLLAELDTRAIAAAVRLPESDTSLCHIWRAALQQNSLSRVGQDEFFITLLADRNLLGATCVGLASNKGGIDQLQFDVAIIDEAGRATVPEILIPILRSHKLILVGDHYQLPPSIAPLLREEQASDALEFLSEQFLDGSFFETMFERLPAQCRGILDRQYRMAPAIGDLVAELFYSRDNQRTLYNGLTEEDFNDRYLLESCIYWLDIKGRQHRPRNGTSYENTQEADAITQFLLQLAAYARSAQTDPITVAVITPYGAQKDAIRRRLAKQQTQLSPLHIDVNTVDAFQGSEADIVCYSTVRTHGNLNFILDRQRLNVACSRAKQHLLFFGDSHFLQHWRARGPSKGKNLFPEILKHASTATPRFRAQS